MEKKNIYHICNLSPIILFRKVEDFLLAISRLASCAYASEVEILAFSIMSTHFHIVVRGYEDDVKGFTTAYKRNLALLHNAEYRANISLQTSIRVVVGNENVIAVLNYVLKNPIHHGIKATAYSYAYSTTTCYFVDEFTRDDRFEGENLPPKYIRPSDLTYRQYRRLFGNRSVADNFRILYYSSNGISYYLVLPESFINVKCVETIYSSPKNFAYQMNRPLKEDVEVFGNDNNAFRLHLSKSELTGQISDIQACEIMDDHIAPRTYYEISSGEKTDLWSYLRYKRSKL